MSMEGQTLQARNERKRMISNLFYSYYSVILLIVMVIVFSILAPNFGTANNFVVILRQTVIVAVVTLGMTFAITAGQIDLSVGGIIALGSMVAALALKAGLGIVVSSLLAILTGAVFGLINGVLIAKAKMPAFLVTLGTASIASGIAMTITKQRPVPLYDPKFALIWGNYQVGPIPMLVIWWLLAFAACYYVYQFTPFGNYVRAVGGNRTAAKYTGINTTKIIIIVMVISGILAGLCALLMTSRVNQGRSDVGADAAMDAITATVLGGTSFAGGKGSIPTAMVGALVMSVLTNALVILGVPTTVQAIIKGVIILIAVAVSDNNKKS